MGPQHAQHVASSSWHRCTGLACAECVPGSVSGKGALALVQAQHLLHHDGLFVGSSAAMNCVGAVKVARQLGPGHTIVTILCDGGHRCHSFSADRQLLRLLHSATNSIYLWMTPR